LDNIVKEFIDHSEIINKYLTSKTMNFKTRQSFNNRLLFVYPSGEVKQTGFIEVAYHGDNYVLAKNSDDVFYSLLDLDGNEIKKDTHVVHRFQNGMLLTYSFFKKDYTSSDLIKYAVNYNMYSILNCETGKSSLIHIVQSDNLLSASSEAISDKYRKTVIKDFLNKPLYRFGDFVFSEVFNFQHIIVGSYFELPGSTIAPFSFDVYKNRRIWGVMDIAEVTAHTGQTDVNYRNLTKLTFKEAELNLADLVVAPEKPYQEDFSEISIYENVKAEFRMINSWKKRSKLDLMLSRMLSL
jgi:hypothetical protein